MTTPQNIGTRIRAARRDRNLTQDELAEIVGVSRSAVAVEYLVHGEDKRAMGEARQGDELALLRLYRECQPEDRQMLLQTARRLARH
jgi:transcriptional regulator with XRE-family HTH domain